MRRLTVVIKPFKVEAVAKALLDKGARSLTLSEARGYGRQKGHLELYRGRSAEVVFLPKVRLECALDEADLEPAIAAIIAAARTGRIGDGKIWIEELA